MQKSELLTMINEASKLFEIVRIVDVDKLCQISVNKDGTVQETPRPCFATWGLDTKCPHCVSAKALSQKRQLTQFEIFNGEAYTLIAKYMEIDGHPYILEIAEKVDSETLFSAFGKAEYVKNMLELSRAVYIDPLTGAYNRRFFQEKFPELENHCAVAFVDLDKFKIINDTFGHDAGDQALKTVVQIILKNIRADDVVVRYGGDELVLSFAQIPQDVFVRRLYEIRDAVKKIVLPAYPELRMTISIGGYYSTDGDRMKMVREADKLCYIAKRNNDDVKVRIC